MDKKSRDAGWIGGPGAETTSKEDDPVARLSAQWEAEHQARTGEIKAELLKERAKAGADELMLFCLAAHDIALSELVGKSEVQLAQRTLALIDNVKHALALAKALRQVSACRDGAARRVQELLHAAGVLRGQRKLAEVTPLRRVA